MDHATSMRLARREAEMFSPALSQALDELGDTNPGLARSILEDGVGRLMGNSPLDHREWAMLVLVALIAIGDTGDQLNVYLEAALHQGASVDEIHSAIELACAYVGAPRAVNSARRLALRLQRGEKPLLGRGEAIVSVGDHETAVSDTGGDGVPLLLLHSLGLDRRFWQPATARLPTGLRTVAYDLRGHGQARGAPLTTGLEQLAADAMALLDLLGIERADVCGSSYGGAIAQHVALAASHRVRSLILIGTAARSPRDALAARAKAAEKDGMASQVAPSLMRWFLPETIAENRWPVRYARSLVRRARVEEWAAAWRAMAGLDVLDRLPGLAMPALVLAGAQDKSAPAELAMQPIAAALPSAEYRLMDPGSHLMAIEQPDAVAAAILAFRTRIENL
jgi:3-oxoadipate enol-lactonase